MADKKKARRFSFSVLMQSRKFLLIVSLLLALAVWWSVMSSSMEAVPREITIDFAVDLTDTVAANQYKLQLVEDAETEVKVTVQGPWSVVSQLSQNDLRVHAKVDTVVKSGKQKVVLEVLRNSSVTDYDILSWSPVEIEINCDYTAKQVFTLETDISALTLADAENSVFGTPSCSDGATQLTQLTLTGPQTTVYKVKRLAAVVEEANTLSETESFSNSPIKAYDDKGAEVDISGCSFDKIKTHAVTVGVPVLKKQTFPVQLALKNHPAKYTAEDFSLSVSEVTVVGPAAALGGESVQQAFTLTVDFNKLKQNEDEYWELTDKLLLPEAVAVEGDADLREIEVTATLNDPDYKPKKSED